MSETTNPNDKNRPTTSMQLFDFYQPQYLQDICMVRGGTNQLFLYHALLAGVKPALDEWIPTDDVDAFLEVCERYSLLTEVESIFFNEGADYVRDSIGAEFLTTTVASGAPPWANYEGRAHIFVSRSEETLDQIKQCGWYPLCVNNRITTKPHIDYLWFGELLGYPKCCIDYFARYNDHNRFVNTLMMPFLNTKSKPDYLCNSLVKDAFCYLYHIPCSFDCCATSDLSSEIRSYIIDHDPGYAEYIDRHLKLNFIVFGERNIYAFDGTADGNTLFYDNVYFVDTYLYPGSLLSLFGLGNKIVFEEDKFTVFNDNDPIDSVFKTNKQEWFFISFADD